MNRTTIVLDRVLRDKCKDLGINISDTCRTALRMELLRHRPRPSLAGLGR